VRLRRLFPPPAPSNGAPDADDRGWVEADRAYLPPVLADPAHGPEEPHRRGRPWITTNMVASVDGAVTVAGRSGGLGSEADREVFRTLRSMADVVMAGAGTVRTERYGPVRLDDDRVEARRARGQQALPTLVVVTNSGHLDGDLPLLDPALVGDGPLPVVVTCAAGEPAARTLGDRVEVLVRGDTRVDLPDALGSLVNRGVGVVVCEGGPTLNEALLADGLLDEVCLTTSPLLASGDAGRIVTGGPERIVDLELAHLLEADGALFARWRVRPGAGG